MNGTAFKDLIERVVSAWALSFVGLLLASGFDYMDLSALAAAGVVSIPAALHVVYGVLATRVGDADTAGFTRKSSNGKH